MILVGTLKCPYNLVFLFNIGSGFFLYNVRKIMQCWQGIWSNRLLSNNSKLVQNKNCQKKMLLKQHYTGFFPVQCCLESLEQHCTGFLPMHCCPKSVTLLNRIFSSAMLSGVSWVKLHKVFTCAMLSQEY